ncbi:MAG TPA: alpha/beta fold hydrolase [Nitrososphaera sp.]|nr:alpha/beta fold hydrolase [Nitrososphaera sp.]
MKKYILFIHGLGSSADRWLDLPDALSLLGYKTYAVDLPGFGESERSADIRYTVDHMTDVIASFAKALDMSAADTVLVGHSLGGYIASRLVARHKLGTGLVLIDSSGLLEGPTPLLNEYLAAAQSPTKQTVRKVMEQMVANPIRIPEALVDGFIYRIQRPGARNAFTTAFESSTSTKLGAEEIAGLQTLGSRIFIIWGEKDILIPTDYFMKFTEALPDARSAMVYDAGHAPFAEKPALVYELLRQFIAELF